MASNQLQEAGVIFSHNDTTITTLPPKTKGFPEKTVWKNVYVYYDNIVTFSLILDSGEGFSAVWAHYIFFMEVNRNWSLKSMPLCR